VPVEQHFRFLLYHTPLVSLVRQAHAVLLESADEAPDASAIRASFERMVGPALGHARELANIYSGTLYCLLAGLVDATPDLAPGTRVGFFSYGSGSCAEIYSGRTVATAYATVARHRIGVHLAARALVDVERYEALVREAETMLASRCYEPPRDIVPGHFERYYGERRRLVLERVENHHRRYAWID
jgi:3-hydroxy-3-methylglutaryl CoA synthase